jgi:hypothetical protein
MKSAHEIIKLKENLHELLLRNDVKIGEPISKNKYLPLTGYEYDAISHELSLIIPSGLSNIFLSWFMKQGLENLSHHEIASTGYMKIMIYL